MTWCGFTADRERERETGMEDTESRESEPGVKTESLSLRISDEGDEASPPSGASAREAAGKHGRAHSRALTRSGERGVGGFTALIRRMNNSARSSMAPRLHGLHYKQRRNPVPCHAMPAQRRAVATQRKCAHLRAPVPCGSQPCLC